MPGDLQKETLQKGCATKGLCMEQGILAENLSEDNSRTQSRKVTITSAKYESM